MEEGTTVKKLWYCPCCEIDSTGKQMCPCPRGSCEAFVAGHIVKTTKIVKNSNYGKK
jgi:hypothetical protein